MKKIIALIIGCLLSGFVWAQPINSIVAVVNDDAITARQLEEQMNLFKAQLAQSKIAVPSDDLLRKQVLSQMIDQQLQLQIAKANNLSVTESQLDAAISQIAAQNKMSAEDFYENLQKQGLTRADFRQEIRNELLVQQLQEQQVGSSIIVTPQEVNNFLTVASHSVNAMTEYHLQDILIALPNTPSSEDIDKARESANQVWQRLKNGEDFSRVAVEVSKDSNALKGGDWGWRKLGELSENLAPDVVRLQKGEYTSPIQTDNGFYIIKLLDMRSPDAEANKVDQYEVQVIFLSKTQNASVLLKQMQLIKAGIDGEKDFGDLARQYSQDQKTAPMGGYLGWVGSDQFDPVVWNQIKTLKPGETSNPIVTKKGDYLVKLLGTRTITEVTSDERHQVEQMLFERKLNDALQNFVMELRRNAYIKIMES